MIEFLDNLEKSIKKGGMPKEVWNDWNQHKATIYFKAYLREELINALSKVTKGSDKDEFHRGVIHTLDQAINYNPGEK